MLFVVSTQSYSQEQTSEVTPEQKDQNFAKRWWNASKNKVSLIYNEGSNDIYVTMYAYHDRFTYTPEKVSELNEGAYGLGFGRSRDNEKGNTEMLFAMTHLDSHSDVQVNAGYAWLKKFKLSKNFRVGIGYAAGLVSRSDFYGRIPIPFALPLGAIDFKRFSLNAILIPKLNDGINNGNVLFIFGKFSWERNK